MKTKAKTAKQVKEMLPATAEITKLGGVFTARRGFFYRNGRTEKDLRDYISDKLTKLEIPFRIIDSGEKMAAFSAGASLRNSSHWWVTFEL